MNRARGIHLGASFGSLSEPFEVVPIVILGLFVAFPNEREFHLGCVLWYRGSTPHGSPESEFGLWVMEFLENVEAEG